MAFGKFGGFMGLTKPYETTWSDGRKVLIFPNGKVVDISTGLLVRQGTDINDFEDVQTVNIQEIKSGNNFSSPMPNQIIKQKDSQLIIFEILALLVLVAIVGIVAIAHGRK